MHIGADGKTSAMRLGLAKKPLRYEQILWPETRRPPKRTRRGREVVVIKGDLLTDLPAA